MEWLWVVAASGLAGFVDAIVGGGGLVLTPALFATYPTAHAATLLGTNKSASVWGTTFAAAQYVRRVQLNWATIVPAMALSFLGSLGGAWLVTRVAPDFLRKLLPLVLLGHSLGGLVAAHAVATGRVRVDGLVLSSPALDPGLTPFQRLLLAVLPRIAPDLGLPNGLDVAALSHDAAVVAAYRADRRVHNRISPRLAQYIAWASAETRAAAPRWRVPTLLLYAGSDRLVDPKGSAAFAAAAPRDVVESQAYPALYHEIFNEIGREAVYARLRAWLDTRFPRR